MLQAGFQSALLEALREDQLVREPEQLRTYECDGLTGRRVVPALVVLAESTADVQAAVRACNEFSVPFVARGAGTGLSGGALPVAEGIVISLARLTRILEIDVELREWDSVRIPPATTRQLEAGPDGLEYLAFGAPNVGSGDAEVVGGWWSD